MEVSLAPSLLVTFMCPWWKPPDLERHFTSNHCPSDFHEVSMPSRIPMSKVRIPTSSFHALATKQLPRISGHLPFKVTFLLSFNGHFMVDNPINLFDIWNLISNDFLSLGPLQKKKLCSPLYRMRALSDTFSVRYFCLRNFCVPCA